jgi:tripartite ATP-independent transporter DctP family solute receptor
MMTRRTVAVFVVIMMFVLSLSGVILASEYTIRLAYEDPPNLQTAPEHAFGVLFKDLVETASNGRIEVLLFPGGTLGRSIALTEMVQSGNIEAAITTGVIGNFFPPFEVIYIPYLFPNEYVAWQVIDGPFMAGLFEEMRKQTGLRVLGVSQNGTRHFTNNVRPIRSPNDLKGLKMRVMESPVYMEMIKAMGATPVPMAFSEVYTALQTGVIDGQENPLWVMPTYSIHEVQKYLTLDGHTWSEDILTINDAFFNRLPEGLQQVVLTAGWQAAVIGRATEVITSQHLGLAKALEGGMQVYTPSIDEIDEFRSVAQGPVIEWMKTKIDEKWINGVLAEVERVERELGLR